MGDQLLDQAALADPRLPEDSDQLTRSALGLVKRCLGLCQGRVAADERSLGDLRVEPRTCERPRGRAGGGAGGRVAGGGSLREDFLIELLRLELGLDAQLAL